MFEYDFVIQYTLIVLLFKKLIHQVFGHSQNCGALTYDWLFCESLAKASSLLAACSWFVLIRLLSPAGADADVSLCASPGAGVPAEAAAGA